MDELYLRRTARGRGLGVRILDMLSGRCCDLGLRVLHLEVHRDNVRARRWYSSFGFRLRAQNHLMTRELKPSRDTESPYMAP
ncbi:MAG: ribosomal protein S18 acetylase RimI-like enzyme [Gammaproteobacteria bacterium]